MFSTNLLPIVYWHYLITQLPEDEDKGRQGTRLLLCESLRILLRVLDTMVSFATPRSWAINR